MGAKSLKIAVGGTGGIGIPPTALLQVELVARHSGSLLKPIEV